jgi:hypothetical protein
LPHDEQDGINAADADLAETMRSAFARLKTVTAGT